MKKTVLVKINCNVEKQLDRQALDSFFERIKLKLKIEHKLPQKNLNKEKSNKI